MIAGLRIPIYTVGFEADLEELDRVSSLVEAASIDASEEDVEFKIAALFNAGG
jgi:Ca-activated chloride channel family protein